MNPTAEYRFDHCQGELGRGHVSRCPRSWLLTARRVARQRGHEGMIVATSIALDVHHSGSSVNPREREMRKGAGRRLT